MSGVRTEFGSLVVPGRDECARCGAAEWTEVDDEATSSATEVGVESETGSGVAADPAESAETEE